MIALLTLSLALAHTCLHVDPTRDLSSIAASPSLDLKRLEACGRHRDALKAARTKRVSINKILDRASGSDVVFMGETHEESGRTAFYRTILRGLVRRDRRFNCLFVETDADSPGGLEFERCNQDATRINRAAFGSHSKKACDSGESLWADLENEAYRLGLKVHAMDAFAPCDADGASAATVDSCRDLAMQKNIQARLSSGDCTKALTINGFPHLTSIFPGHEPLGQRPLVDREGRSLKSFRLNAMFSTREKSINGYDARWRWIDWNAGDEKRTEICSPEDQPGSTARTFGFLRDSSIRGPFVWSDGRPAGDWSDFDATIVMGTDVP